MSFLADISKFQNGNNLVTPPKHAPHWTPEEGTKPVVGSVLPGLVPRQPRPKREPLPPQPAPEPEPEPEVFEPLTQHPLVTWLQNLGVELDVEAYVTNLTDCVGMHTVDDVILAEPSHEDLISWGFADESDRNKVYYAIHPEEAPNSAAISERELALFDMVMTKIDEGTATDDELEFFVMMKAKMGR